MLDLSHNILTAFEGQPSILPWETMERLYLNSNSLQGSLPSPPLSTSYFFASENKLAGRIPELICEVTSLFILDLSNNNLSGPIPQCFKNFSTSLFILNLGHNNLHGNIPSINASDLRTLDLSYNRFQGQIPRSLANCLNLEVLNLANNHINDIFPFWLKTQPFVLVLRSNEFHGPIWDRHTTHTFFPNLQIIDISHNNFNGKLPADYFLNWKGMMREPKKLGWMYVGTLAYNDTVTVNYKGKQMTLKKIFNNLALIDFSSNKFEGEIPHAIGSLKSLVGLNLSRNNFTGQIPLSLVNLTVLESLDLSENHLRGDIPQDLANLTFLAFLNLSQNQLTGSIPQGRQFGAFQKGAFEGNPGLCGLPLPKKCGDSDNKQRKSIPPQRKDSMFVVDKEYDRKAVLMGCACGMVIGLIVGHIMLTPSRIDWCLHTFGWLKRRQT